MLNHWCVPSTHISLAHTRPPTTMNRIKYNITKAELHENPFCIYLFSLNSVLLTPIIINICMYYILFLIQCLPPNYSFTIKVISSWKKWQNMQKCVKKKVRNNSSHHPTSICLRKLAMTRLTPRSSKYTHTHTHTHIHSVFLLHNGILYISLCCLLSSFSNSL